MRGWWYTSCAKLRRYTVIIRLVLSSIQILLLVPLLTGVCDVIFTIYEDVLGKVAIFQYCAPLAIIASMVGQTSIGCVQITCGFMYMASSLGPLTLKIGSRYRTWGRG